MAKKVNSPNESSRRVQRNDDWRLQFLHSVIDAEVTQTVPRSLPKKGKMLLETEIAAKGGIFPWARAQPQYADLRKKKLDKRTGRHGGLPETKITRPSASAVKRPSTGIDAEIAGHLLVIDAAISEARKLLADVGIRQQRIEELLACRGTD
ncbi:hypothetical protein [Rhizobium sp. TRM95796]|uniref:hypothetical protein n=1 Tax=Rhizobium sp. TRM95796 TaxID=2979862 RepID=UPI0021E76291|nr:hypothetical protein [Rhizobium sp. TRM95796]MCV3765102.1 hypothetical protein [Rhizobium sp. TRM95796]